MSKALVLDAGAIQGRSRLNERGGGPKQQAIFYVPNHTHFLLVA